MHKPLLYDPMPKKDVEIPPISEPRMSREDARRLIESADKEEPKDLLANLNFG